MSESRQLVLEVKTGPSGAYIFRNLPAGTYTVAIDHEGGELIRRVTLPPEPATLRDIDLNAGTK